MKIALHDADKTKLPKLALLKLAAYHKARGDSVEWYMPLANYDVIYSSKVFTWTPESRYLPAGAQLGGTGYGLMANLPEEVEHTCPDYDFGRINFSMGFLTRGCPRNCPWCIVPVKEGPIRAHADIEEFARHRDVVLMDNNVLAHDHGIAQIEKMARLGLRVDFNQGLDSRLIDADIARRLAALKWLKPVRLACDHKKQMPDVERAVRHLRNAGVTPRRYRCYVLAKDVDDALERIYFLEGLKVDPFAMPYRDLSSTAEPCRELKRLARWCNRPWIRKSCWFADYEAA